MFHVKHYENLVLQNSLIAPIEAVTPQQALEKALERGVRADSGISF